MNTDKRPDAFIDAMERLNRDVNRRESPPSVQEACAPTVPDPVADTARALARLWRDAGAHVGYAGTDTEYRRRLRIRRVAIEDAAHACGSQVYAAFNALVTGDAGRAPEVGDA